MLSSNKEGLSLLTLLPRKLVILLKDRTAYVLLGANE